jgi:hypothetical protein
MIPREPDEMDIDPKAAPGLSAAWSREIERRLREIDEGTVELIDWEEIRKELFEEPI